jgi:lysozyme
MMLSAKGAQFLRLHEGFRAKAYRDPIGLLTIGVGMTWRSAAFRSWWNTNKGIPFDSNSTMTEAEADACLQYMVEREYGKAVNDFLGGPVKQHVYDAMVSAVFNMGPGSLKWQWAKAAAGGDYELAARLLMKTGTTAKGKTLTGLVRRRKEEALLLQHGVYTGIKPVTNPRENLAPQKIPSTISPSPPAKPSKWWQRLFGLKGN